MTLPMVPELELLRACGRMHLRDADREAIDAVLAVDPDWDRVLRLARWHGLRPLLHRHLSAVASDAVPRVAMVELWCEAEAIARRNRALQAELDRIGGLLEATGIRAMPYKGPRLALTAYGDLAMREFGDLDILVPRADLLAARAALCAAGYVDEYPLQPQVREAFMASGAQYHWVLRSAALGHLVELHWKTDPDFPVERLEDPAWWAQGPLDWAQRSLSPEDLLLVLCIHGTKHGWSSLGWIVDVAELLRSRAAIDWGHFCDRASALGGSRRIGVGLRLASELLDAPLEPAALALAQRADVVNATTTILPAILAPEPESPGTFEGLRQSWVMAERPRLRTLLVFRVICLPTLVEWTRWPLPRALFFAYPILRLGRLAAKYARRGWQGAFAS